MAEEEEENKSFIFIYFFIFQDSRSNENLCWADVECQMVEFTGDLVSRMSSW